MRRDAMPDTIPPTPPQLSNVRLTGAIRALKEGFGFIAGDDGYDYFFHWSAMNKDSKNFRDLSIQERVEFGVAVGPKGVRAIMIKVI